MTLPMLKLIPYLLVQQAITQLGGGGNLESVTDTITRLRIDMNGSGTIFTGGKVKVLYEG